MSEHPKPALGADPNAPRAGGRPPEMEEREKLQVYVPAAVADRIRHLALKRGVTVSSQVRRLLARALRER